MMKNGEDGEERGGGKREKSWNIARQWILLILSMINAITKEEGKDK